MDTGDIGLSFRKSGREGGRKERGGVHGMPPFALRTLWDHELASSAGTARERLGLRQSSAAFTGMHRMGKRRGSFSGFGRTTHFLWANQRFFLKDFSSAPVPTTESEPLLPKETI